MDADEKQELIRQQLMEAADALAPPAAAKLGLEDREQLVILTELCMGMFNAGIRAGATQAISQLAAQGVDVTVNMDPSLFPHAD